MRSMTEDTFMFPDRQEDREQWYVNLRAGYM